MAIHGISTGVQDVQVRPPSVVRDIVGEVLTVGFQAHTDRRLTASRKGLWVNTLARLCTVHVRPLLIDRHNVWPERSQMILGLFTGTVKKDASTTDVGSGIRRAGSQCRPASIDAITL